MKKLSLAAAVLTFASTALANEDTGTSAVGEMSLSGGQFAMLAAAIVGLGVVVWLVAKVANR